MAPRFTFRVAASDDVATAYDRYEDEAPGLGERFLHAVGDCGFRTKPLIDFGASRSPISLKPITAGRS